MYILNFFLKVKKIKKQKKNPSILSSNATCFENKFLKNIFSIKNKKTLLNFKE